MQSYSTNGRVVSEFIPNFLNEGALVQVEPQHPPNFPELDRMKYLQPLEEVKTHESFNIKVELCDVDLWRRFAEVGTEMILTNGGRRMFPGFRVKLAGLNPDVLYFVMMDIVNVDEHRYKYQEGEWMVAGRGESHSRQNLFIHPSSPAQGRRWMSEAVSFQKAKLSNCRESAPYIEANIILNSMHRYIPRVHIVRTYDVRNLLHEPVSTFSFPLTIFIAVTAYQNGKVTKLKIENNPFARGFRDNRAARSSDSANRSCHSRDGTTSQQNDPNKSPANEEGEIAK